jgi:hypothetical protein
VVKAKASVCGGLRDPNSGAFRRAKQLKDDLGTFRPRSHFALYNASHLLDAQDLAMRPQLVAPAAVLSEGNAALRF